MLFEESSPPVLQPVCDTLDSPPEKPCQNTPSNSSSYSKVNGDHEEAATPPMPILEEGVCYTDCKGTPIAEENKQSSGNKSVPLWEKLAKEFSISHSTGNTQTDQTKETESLQEKPTKVEGPPPAKRKPARKRKRAVACTFDDYDTNLDISVKGRTTMKLQTLSEKKKSSSSEKRYLKSPYITMNTNQKHSKKSEVDRSEIANGSFKIVNPAFKDTIGHLEDNSIMYRPLVKVPKSNELNENSMSHDGWSCIFCGRNSSFLYLGCLYGPYKLEETTMKKLPRWIVQESANPPEEDSVLKTNENGSMKVPYPDGQNSYTDSPRSKQRGQREKRNSQRISKEFEMHSSSLLPNTHFRIGIKGDVWFHRECVLWCPGTYLTGNGTIGGLDDSLLMALEKKCTLCDRFGATLNCRIRGCTKVYHYFCSKTVGCRMDSGQFSILCDRHKV